MSRGRIVDAVKSGKTLVSDGSWGTMLFAKGLPAGGCPERWDLEKPDEVADVARQYAEAGADMVEANSFGGTCYKLEHYGLADKVAEINEAAARASRKGVGENVWVIASVGPTGKLLVTEEVTPEELYNAFKEQVVALEKGGADAVCIETMSDLEEACLAIKATKENTNLEVICTFSFEITKRGDFRTMMGLSPEDAAVETVKAGADVIGTNCGNGIERMIDIVKAMRTVDKTTPILVHANAGLPQNIDGVDTFPDTPEDMARMCIGLVDAGANIIGGCCGSFPAHIKAMKEAITNYKK